MTKQQTTTKQIAIGIGCSSSATSADILTLIRTSISSIPSDAVLATLDRRSPIAESVAETLNLRLILFPAASLAQVHGVLANSPIALAETGTANVAEAAALAALGPRAMLLIPRQTGHLCTCAVAILPEEPA